MNYMMRTGNRNDVLRRMRIETAKRAATIAQQMDRVKTKYAVCMDELEIIDKLIKEAEK